MKNYFMSATSMIKCDLLFVVLSIFIVAVVFAIDSALGSVTGVTLAMAAGGSQVRNSQIADGAGWDNKYSIAAAYAALLENVEETVADNFTKVRGWYNSSTAFSTNKAQYDGFPVGSKIIDTVAKKEYLHDTATTWLAVTYA